MVLHKTKIRTRTVKVAKVMKGKVREAMKYFRYFRPTADTFLVPFSIGN